MIEHHEGRLQVCCDSCPASCPDTYARDDFTAMIADAKAAGWRVRRAPPTDEADDTAELFSAPPRLARREASGPQPYTHTCPDCLESERPAGSEDGRLV